jgi:hypothetical protein
VLGAVASNWEIVAIAVGVPCFVLALLLAIGSTRVLVPVWTVLAVAFAVVAGFGLYYAFRPVPTAAVATPRAGAPTQSPSPTGAPPPTGGGPGCSPHGPSLALVAKNIAYDTKCLAAPANTALTIRFTNRDPGTTHNVHILTANPASDPNARNLFVGQLVTGPATSTYRVPALRPGTYYFHCDIHPTIMFGSLLVP